MEIFHSFPSMQGPALEGQMLDFMGISTRSAVACFDAGHGYPLVMTHIAIENCHLQWNFPSKMMMFYSIYSYVSLPDGNNVEKH